MATPLNFGRDVQGYNAEAPRFSTNIFSGTIATGTPQSFTVPGDSATWIMYIRVQPNGWVWVSRTGTAAVPAGAPIADSASELAPGTLEYKRTVFAGDVISVTTVNTTADVGVTLYPVPQA